MQDFFPRGSTYLTKLFNLPQRYDSLHGRSNKHSYRSVNFVLTRLI